ncbi:MAG: hypothetical protein WC742_02790 [Gallionellaceae bacterium]|jgi:LysR family cys regulon transcriptional activator
MQAHSPSQPRDDGADTELRLLKCNHLFAANNTYIALLRWHFLRSFTYRYIELCSPKLDEAAIHAGAQPL